ncbi:MAG: AAA family ATPase [Candidatus Peribacteria bacterium]|nr:AAA family ATPase [Candidatus Peribacteria bacterium]
MVFFDELSGLVPKRENLDNAHYKEEEVNEFLIQLNDASKHQILVIGATNFPDRIDTAVMRAGRLDKRIYI